MKIAFLTRSLEYGGAERQLAALALGLKARGDDVSIMMFYGGGPMEAELRQAGVPLIDLRKRGRWDLFALPLRLVKVLRRDRPDVVYSILPPQNLLAGLLRPAFRPTRVVWGIRASTFDLSGYDWLTRWSYTLERRLSSLPDLVIVNSQAGLNALIAGGFPVSKTRLVSNGIDCRRFRPDPGARQRVREEWGVADGEHLVGLVARFDPLKDPETFLNAAALLAAERKRSRFVCVGDGPAKITGQLRTLAQRLDLSDRMIWAGARNDMPAVYNALDVLCLSSISEGFPNVIGEAMACGVACVVTDVGDSARIVGGTGIVVPPRDPGALAEGWRRMLELSAKDRAELGDRVRSRIQEAFSIEALCRNVTQALSEPLG